MKITLLKFSISLNLIFLFLSVQNVFACQCYGFDTPYQAYKSADAVFVGKVISIKNSLGQEVSQNKVSNWWENYREKEDGSESNHFVVQEWFKGEHNSEIVINTSNNMCENGFGANESALVYAHKNKDGSLWTGLFCSRTTAVDSAQADINFLRELVANKPEPRIYGAIYLNENGRQKYLESIKIIAQSDKKQYVTFTDEDGLYRFYELPDGKYAVKPELPNVYADYFWSRNRLEEITLQKNQDYNYEYFKSFGPNAYADFAVDWNNKISGRVLDAEGKSLNRATIRLLPLNEISDKSFNEEEKSGETLDWEDRASNLRKFEKRGNTPGKYILALEVFAPFPSGQEKLRMYYPQAITPDKAEIIDIGETTQRNIDLKLPFGFLVREIEGTFLWGSGVSIENGWVSIEKMENSDDSNNVVYESQRADKGYFKFQVFENAEYWIHGKFDNQKAKPFKIKVGKINEPIKLCITLIKGYKSENCSNN